MLDIHVKLTNTTGLSLQKISCITFLQKYDAGYSCEIFNLTDGFICYVLTHDNFIKLKAEKRKIPFLVTKRSQKFNLTNFSHPRPPNCVWIYLLLLTQNVFDER